MSLSITARKRARLAYASAVSNSANYNDKQVDPDVFSRRRKIQMRLRTLATVTSDYTTSTTTTTTLPEENEEDDIIESDTLSTIRYIFNIMLAKNKGIASRLPRMCMVNQLYSILSDNTNVDRELVGITELPQFKLSQPIKYWLFYHSIYRTVSLNKASSVNSA